MFVDEIIAGVHARLSISSLDMKDKLRGHLLMRQDKLGGHYGTIIIRSTGGDYSLQALATNLRIAYRSEGLPLSSMATVVTRASCGTLLHVSALSKTYTSNVQCARQSEPSPVTLLYKHPTEGGCECGCCQFQCMCINCRKESACHHDAPAWIFVSGGCNSKPE